MSQTIALLDLISEFPEPFRDPELPPPSLPQTMASLPPAEPLPEESMGRSVKDICLEAIAIIESMIINLFTPMILHTLYIQLTMDIFSQKGQTGQLQTFSIPLVLPTLN